MQARRGVRLMEIKEKIKIKGREIECEIDTGATYIVVKEEILKEIGSEPKGKIKIGLAKDVVKEVDYYVESVEINGCKLPPQIIIAGKTNLLGHVPLQMMGAVIDEKEGKITYRVCPPPYAEV